MTALYDSTNLDIVEKDMLKPWALNFATLIVQTLFVSSSRTSNVIIRIKKENERVICTSAL
jgi:hypothetical protein